MHGISEQLELTPREVEVIRHVAAGMSAKEIAILLSIAPSTVERHVENVRLKTRTRNRAHMVAYLLRVGLLPPARPSGNGPSMPVGTVTS